MRRVFRIFAVIMALLICVSSASAHSGRTDGQGGHKDNKNKSGLGSYHYHHGMSAHLHPNGICPYAPKDTIAISNIPKSIDVGDSVSLEWDVTYYSSSGRVEWASSAPEVVDVSSGVLTAKAPGKATITANLVNGSKSFNVTSKEVFPSEIVIPSVPEKISITNSESISASLSPSNVTNKELSWVSSNPDVLSVSETGELSALATGTATITVAASGGVKRAFKIEVYEILPERIIVSDKSLDITINSTHTVSATIEPADTSNKTMQWASTNPDVASVDENGVVSTHQVGTAVVTASCQSVSVDIPVDVYYIKASALSFEEETIKERVDLEETISPVVVFSPVDATYKDITYTSSDENVLKVNGGTISAVGVGKATITATSKDATVSADVEVRNPDDAKAVIGFICVPLFLLLAAVWKKGYDRRKKNAENPQSYSQDASKNWHYRRK